ncbi:MAG: bifunctional precorrin-2 dehydrogenase/sirohydrochlorin ferrochelatase [Desulfobacterales bacterium]|nr:bifunctional precorrin-2 dehydrogenase/sirohydrochlorin ferrochelatase [Desulfobacterales bacterium]
MAYYPVFLNLKGRQCLVVGGGGVGTRKALMLKRCGATVKIISPEISPELEASELAVEKREFTPEDLDRIFLVFAATGNAQVNQTILEQAQERNILCNSADAPDQGDFILPAVVQRGDLVCAVSTSGASPALSKKIRRDLESFFGPEYEPFLALMAQIRKRLLGRGHDPQGHRQIFRQLVNMDIPQCIAQNDIPAIDAALADLIGTDFTYSNLMSQES